MENPKILVLDRSEELAERVRAITAEMTPPPEIVSCTKIGSASHVNHEHEGPFAVMVAGPSLGTKTGLKRLALLHRDSPSTSIIMGFDQRPEASLRDIIQVGADDIIELPGDDTSIKGAIKRALELAEKRLVPTSGSQVVVQAQTGARPLGKVFTVSSATGGCGKTFYATNIALLLSQLPNTLAHGSGFRCSFTRRIRRSSSSRSTTATSAGSSCRSSPDADIPPTAFRASTNS